MRRLRALTLILLFVLLSAPGAATAATGGDQLGLSWDGQSWVDSLTGSLFDRAGSIHAWVPGDSDTEHFYARNQSGEGARLTIAYELPPNALVNADDFQVSASVDGGAAVALTPGTGWLDLDGRALADGRSADIAVTAAFRSSSTNASQRQSFPLAFRVTLSGIPGPAADTGGADGKHSGGMQPGSGNGGGLLPNTGAPEVRWALGLGLFALGGGIAIVMLARRKDRDAEAS